MFSFLAASAALSSSSFRTYVGRGAMTAMGLDPTEMSPLGNQVHHIGNNQAFVAMHMKPGTFMPDFVDIPRNFPAGAMERAAFAAKNVKAYAGAVPNIATTAYFAYQGYKTNGIAGAVDSITQELAVTSAVTKFGYGAGPMIHGGKLVSEGAKIAGAPLRGRGLTGRYVGSAIGSAIGGSIAGKPGEFLGAYIGAAPIQNMRFGAYGAALAATAAVSYGAYSVVKGIGQEAYARRQNLRGVNTSGDMSAFMTQGAFTMRSRAIQAMSKSHMNARSALGQEANFSHMPYRNPLSRYAR